jgi:peroxiredoxin
MISACSEGGAEKSRMQSGPWVFMLHLDANDPQVVLPFNVEAISDSQLIVTNASEKIKVTEVFYRDDSVRIIMPVFGSEFIGKVRGDTIRGNWHKYATTRAYKIPFIAVYGKQERFVDSGQGNSSDFSGRWKSSFISQGDTSSAIGIFGQSGRKVTGTFLTETGDYRYLEGIADGNRLRLSTFDGAHAFLFEGSINDEGELNGYFRSGPSWQARWLASRDADMQLADMKSLTFLKEGYERLSFSFPDEAGTTVSLDDEKFKDKVVIVQIFGSWCPNCMDETRFLVDLYESYKDQGLEVIGIDFEPRPTLEYFRSRMERYRQDLNVNYTLLLGGSSNKEKAAEAMPMLNNIISFPTAIIIDRAGKIREIHTGFAGPGTGISYGEYTRDTEQLVNELLTE